MLLPQHDLIFRLRRPVFAKSGVFSGPALSDLCGGARRIPRRRNDALRPSIKLGYFVEYAARADLPEGGASADDCELGKRAHCPANAVTLAEI